MQTAHTGAPTSSRPLGVIATLTFRRSTVSRSRWTNSFPSSRAATAKEAIDCVLDMQAENFPNIAAGQSALLAR